MRLSIFFFLSGFILSCTPNLDGSYCADVDYYNYRTGQESSYRLITVLRNGKLKEIRFPNGGHLDEGDFGSVYIKGEIGLAKYDSKTYRIKILQSGENCFGDVERARQCKALTKSGERCKNQTDNKSGNCWKHD